jgi:hypothetical protein
MGSVFRILTAKSEGEGPLGRSRRRWEDNKMDLEEAGWESVDWIHLARDRTGSNCCEH